MVTTVRPKAKATPTKPIPRAGKAAASTALPQPPKTSQKVPKNSAMQRRESGIVGIAHLSFLRIEQSSSYGCGAVAAGSSRTALDLAARGGSVRDEESWKLKGDSELSVMSRLPVAAPAVPAPAPIKPPIKAPLPPPAKPPISAPPAPPPPMKPAVRFPLPFDSLVHCEVRMG